MKDRKVTEPKIDLREKEKTSHRRLNDRRRSGSFSSYWKQSQEKVRKEGGRVEKEGGLGGENKNLEVKSTAAVARIGRGRLGTSVEDLAQKFQSKERGTTPDE